MDLSTKTNPVPKTTSDSLLTRVFVSVVLLPIAIAAIWYSSWTVVLAWGLLLALAAWEYVALFRAGGYQPAGFLVVGGVILLAAARALSGFESAPWLLSALVLVSMAYHLVQYELGRDQAASDFGLTLAGLLYIGWVGAYLISLRMLPEGEVWLLLVLVTIWLADSGGYIVGKSIGRRKLSPRLSPKKTWEGYWGGAAFAILGAALFSWLWSLWAGPDTNISLVRGVLIGLALGLLPTLGDLGESMIKRQVGAKDSGKLLPGHGGIFDRIDSWLWGCVIGYYLVVWLVGP